MSIYEYSDYLEIIKKNFGRISPRLIPGCLISRALHCEVCGLEGCHKSNHNLVTDPFEMGDDKLFSEPTLQEEVCQ